MREGLRNNLLFLFGLIKHFLTFKGYLRNKLIYFRGKREQNPPSPHPTPPSSVTAQIKSHPTLFRVKYYLKTLRDTWHFCCVQIFFKNSFRNTIRVSNDLDSDKGRHSVRPDLVLNCLQRSISSHQVTHSKERVNVFE